MSDYIEIIRRNHTTLVKEIDAEELVDHLYQVGVVDADEMEKIRNKSQNKCRKDGTKELLKILRKNGSQAVLTFVSILPDVGYADLAGRLKESQKRPHPEPTSVVPEHQSKVLDNHSNRIQQLEQQVAALRSENQEMKAQMKAMKPNQAVNSKNQTKSNTDNMNKQIAKNEKQLQLEKYDWYIPWYIPYVPWRRKMYRIKQK